MRIAIISTPFIRVPPDGYGGTELFCYELAEELHARHHEVTIFTTGDSVVRCRKRFLYPRGQWPMTAADEFNHIGWAFSEIARSTAGFDVVQTNSPLSIPLAPFLKLPIVHTIHHKREDEFSRIYAIHPDVHYVGISRRQLSMETSLPHATVIHHGVSPESYPVSREDAGYLLHLGRFAAEKGTDLAIDVAEKAGLRLVLAGRVHPQDHAFFASSVAPRLGHPYVELVGEADSKRKVELLRGARALVCPLRWEEPFGLVVVEAMMCGTPVLGFARGAFPEIIDEGVTGFSIPADDVEGMAKIAQSLDRFDRLACARRARERFTTSAMTDAYQALFRRALAERAHPRAA